MRPIVVADQSPSLRKLFELTFGDEYEVLFADSEQSLKSTVEESNPSIIFLDADFVQDVSVLQELISSIDSIPVILLRGEFSEVESLEGVSREVKKPFDPDELIQCYEELALTGSADSSDFDDLFSSVGRSGLDEEVSKEINDLFRSDSKGDSDDLDLAADLEDIDLENLDLGETDLEGLLGEGDPELPEDTDIPVLETAEEDDSSDMGHTYGADKELSLDDVDLEGLDGVLETLESAPLETAAEDAEALAGEMDWEENPADDEALDALKDAEGEEFPDIEENPYLNVEEAEEARPQPESPSGAGDHHIRLTDLQLTIPEEFTPKVYFPEPKGEFSELRVLIERSYIEDFLKQNLRQHLREVLSEQIEKILPEIAREVVEEELERLKQIKIDDI